MNHPMKKEIDERWAGELAGMKRETRMDSKCYELRYSNERGIAMVQSKTGI